MHSLLLLHIKRAILEDKQMKRNTSHQIRWDPPNLAAWENSRLWLPQRKNEPCQEFRGQTVLQIEAVHNLRKVRMYLNVLSLRSTS